MGVVRRTKCGRPLPQRLAWFTENRTLHKSTASKRIIQPGRCVNAAKIKLISSSALSLRQSDFQFRLEFAKISIDIYLLGDQSDEIHRSFVHRIETN